MGEIIDNIKAAEIGNPYTGNGIVGGQDNNQTQVMGLPDISKRSYDNSLIMDKPMILVENGPIVDESSNEDSE